MTGYIWPVVWLFKNKYDYEIFTLNKCIIMLLAKPDLQKVLTSSPPKEEKLNRDWAKLLKRELTLETFFFFLHRANGDSSKTV